MDYRGHAHHELRERRIREALAEQSTPLERVCTAQRARRVAGLVGITGFASLPLAALVAWVLDRERAPTEALSLILLAALVLMPVGYVLARRAWTRIRVDAETADLRLARFRGDVVATRERQLASNAPLLVAAALLGPLGLQAFIGIPVVGLKAYGAWIGGAGALTSLAHLVLAFGGWRAVKHWVTPQDVPFRNAPSPWWELLWASVAAAAPMVCFGLWMGDLVAAVLAPMAVGIITFLTGGLFWPYLHRQMHVVVQADAAALRSIDEALDHIDTAVRIEDIEGDYAEEHAVVRREQHAPR